ncbi:hypothetical protein [Coprococcus sp. B2-R-112]|uniref:hypothetical protein n=1 Tax=Coprococcus sp. B2-R-112 TaxID=2949662 RepID=UPI003FA4318E
MLHQLHPKKIVPACIFHNEKTARLYTDLSLITARPEIGMEASRIFQALSLGTVVDKTKHLLMAPKCLQKPVLEMTTMKLPW